METKIFSSETIKEAGTLLRQGQLIAFPTETVYGLGAIASDDLAIKDVYRVKGRPSDNPVIVHVANKEVSHLVAFVPPAAEILMEKFWPGPLTLIFKAKEGVFAPAVTAGRDTVSLRMPDQSLTLKLIEETGFPIVGPSANTSGKPSPTSVDHVLHDMNGKIAGIMDGGSTHIGVESTVLDLTDEKGPIILRPGAVSREMLEEILDMKVWTGGEMGADKTEIPKAPGMKYIHYSPKQPVILVTGNISDWLDLIAQQQKEGETIGILASKETIEQLESQTLSSYSLGEKENPAIASQKLYAGLRHFDEKEVTLILAEAYPKSGIGEAFMNRLEKASSASYPNT